MHPAGRICELPPMTVLTSASHVKVTPCVSLAAKKSPSASFRSCTGRLASRETALLLARSSIKRSVQIYVRGDFKGAKHLCRAREELIFEGT